MENSLNKNEEQNFEDLYAQSYKEAYIKAIKYLGIRSRTVQMMTDYLLKKGYDDVLVDVLVQKLKEYRYLSDVQYCKTYYESYRCKYGINRIKAELRQKGVSEHDILDGLSGEEDDHDAAIKSAQKYIRTHNKVTRQKVYAFLMQRGFSYAAIKEAMASVQDTIKKENEEYED